MEENKEKKNKTADAGTKHKHRDPNGFCKVLLSNHIKTCVVQDIKEGKEEEAVEELCETIKKMM